MLLLEHISQLVLKNFDLFPFDSYTHRVHSCVYQYLLHTAYTHVDFLFRERLFHDYEPVTQTVINRVLSSRYAIFERRTKQSYNFIFSIAIAISGSEIIDK